MGFIADIERQSQSMRQAILAHPFVKGVGDGTLPVEKFKYYITQDYAYLIDYSRALALASARAPRLDDMSWFAGLLDETLNVEMALHRSYCQEFGISAQELDATVASPTPVAYTLHDLEILREDEVAPVVESGMSIVWCPMASMLFGVGGTGVVFGAGEDDLVAAEGDLLQHRSDFLVLATTEHAHHRVIGNMRADAAHQCSQGRGVVRAVHENSRAIPD